MASALTDFNVPQGWKRSDVGEPSRSPDFQSKEMQSYEGKPGMSRAGGLTTGFSKDEDYKFH